MHNGNEIIAIYPFYLIFFYGLQKIRRADLDQYFPSRQVQGGGKNWLVVLYESVLGTNGKIHSMHLSI